MKAVNNKHNCYVCPDCKSALEPQTCSCCGRSYSVVDNIWVLYGSSDLANRYREIGRYYDEIYAKDAAVWETVASRGPTFHRFIASLVSRFSPKRCLDIGCGQGFQLEALSCPEKYGLELSLIAAQAAARRSHATVCLGISEELPFTADFFDAVTCIGVLTHLVDSKRALGEIRRVLKSGGVLVVGVCIRPGSLESAISKLVEFIYPRLRPLAFAKWAVDKLLGSSRRDVDSNSIQPRPQPIEHVRSPGEFEREFVSSGFLVEKVITKARNPSAPLSGSHFRVYILRRSQTSDK